ncbi:MAG: hypothetical protein SNJ71_01655 [Bacteroidales bacterium]
METLYPDELKAAIEYMKKKVKSNLATIKSNQEKIFEILKNNKGVNYDREDIRKYKEQNNTLLSQNNELIKIEQLIINFIYSTFTREKEEDTIIFMTRDQAWEKTINGELEIDDNHPLISDSEFVSKLLDHYLQREEYEKCASLKMYLK